MIGNKHLRQTPALFLHEWLAVTGMCVGLLLLTLSTVHMKSKSALRDTSELHVFVTGEVEACTQMTLPHGANVADILAHIHLTAHAAVEKLALHTSLKNNQIVVIPKQNAVSVYVQGAVQKEGVVTLPQGATFKELKEKLVFSPEANVGAFQRKRRKLKDGEVINIPCRKVCDMLR